MLTTTIVLSTWKIDKLLTEDIQHWINHYGFILQSPQQDTAVQGWII